MRVDQRPYADLCLSLRTAYYDFPQVIGIETLALCNARCGFCPYPKMERKGQRMPDETVEKILDDVASIAGRPPFRFNLSRVNEPFLDTRVLEISAEINRRLPEAGHVFFSNASPLDEAALLRLSRIRNVCFLNLSVNDHRPEQYEAVMGLPFARTCQRLRTIHEMKAANVLDFPVVLSRVGDGTAADKAFSAWVEECYPLFRGQVNPRGGWLGAIEGASGQAPDVGCTQWFKLHFLADGRSAFCCIDSDARLGDGDATSKHVIHQIYNSPARRRLREVASRLEINACRHCPLLA